MRTRTSLRTGYSYLRNTKSVWILIVLLTSTMSLTAAAESSAQRWQRAIMSGDIQSLNLILEQSEDPSALAKLVADSGKSALMTACKLGNENLATQLLEFGADPNARTITGGTPFMFASLGGHTQLLRLLNQYEVDIDARGSNGWSAATIAAAKGYAESLSYLLELGVDVNVPDVYGWTPLMRAVDNQHAAAVDALLAHSPTEINHQDETGNTALHHAAAKGDEVMLDKLLRAGADRSLLNSSEKKASQLVMGLPNSDELEALLSRF